MAKYAIWDKKTPIITPSGEVFTAEQWMDRYPVAKLDNVTILCSPGEINGAFFGTLGQFVDMYTSRGYDFSGCSTPEEKLAKIEEISAAEAEKTKVAREEQILKEEMNQAALASIAASMEYQNLLTLDDVEVQ